MSATSAETSTTAIQVVNDFQIGRDYSIVLWAGYKTPLVDGAGNLTRTTTSASAAMANTSPNSIIDLKLSRVTGAGNPGATTKFVAPAPPSSNTQEVLEYASEDDDFAICEVLESPANLLDVLEQGKYFPPGHQMKIIEMQKSGKKEDAEALMKVDFELPPHLYGIDSLMVMTPGNFASADFYAQFVKEVRKLHPNVGVLVLGHAGIQSSDRNNRVGFSIRNYKNLNAHFIYEIALSERSEKALKMMEAAGQHQKQQQQPEKKQDQHQAKASTTSTVSDDGGEKVTQEEEKEPVVIIKVNHTSAESKNRHPRLILAAHSVGSYILLKALEQLTQIPRWNKFMNLERVVMYAPVIQNFKTAPAGDGAGKWVSKLGAGFIAYGAVLPFWLLPMEARCSIFESLGGVDPLFAHRLARTVRPSSVWNCLQLARGGFEEILDLESVLINGIGKKLHVYYVQNDGWVPESYIQKFRDECTKANVWIEKDEKVGHSCCVTAPAAAARAIPLI